MAVKWQKTSFPGVRFYEHATRKHGVKLDRYYTIRYQFSGKSYEEKVGWSSEGWTAQKASIIRAECKKAHLLGEGPTSLAEKREIKAQKESKAEKARQQAKKDSLTFGEFFLNQYFPLAKNDKAETTCKREMILFNKWLNPYLGNKALKAMVPLDIERIKKAMLDKGQAGRSVEYMIAVVRQVFNYAKDISLYSDDNPAKKIKKPKFDNKRTRFLTDNEAASLLNALKKRSMQTYQMSFLSLYTGLRAKEIFSLTWADIDLGQKTIFVKDTKTARNRFVYMTMQVEQMFKKMFPSKPQDLVFPARPGGQMTRISPVFQRTVTDLGFNEGIQDRRQKVVFHTLRHTFASWLVQSGTDLFVVQRLLGHTTATMTQRYSHLCPDNYKEALKNLEKGIMPEPDNVLALSNHSDKIKTA